MKSEVRKMLETDPEKLKRVLMRLRAKHTEAEIRSMLQISTRPLNKIYRTLGLIRDHFKPTDQELRTMTPRQLSEKYGFSLSRVHKYVREHLPNGPEPIVDQGDPTGRGGPDKLS